MTETGAAILGSLIGAASALVGAFGAQFFIARQATKRRRQELIASFLSSQGGIALQASEALGEDPLWTGAWRSALREKYERSAAIGHELALLCVPDVAEQIRRGLSLALDVWRASDPVMATQEERRQTATSLEEATTEMSTLMHDEYRT